MNYEQTIHLIDMVRESAITDGNKKINPVEQPDHIAVLKDSIRKIFSELENGKRQIRQLKKEIQTTSEDIAWKSQELGAINEEYKAYSEILIEQQRKLEDKAFEIAEANKKLKTEVSERKQTENILKKSEKKYRRLINNIPGFVYNGYIDWSVDFVDNNVGERTGYQKSDFDSRKIKWSDLISQSDISGGKDAILNSLKNNKPYVREFKIITKYGKTMWLQDRGTITLDSTGKIDHFSGVLFDITKQKEAEESLREKEQYYRSILTYMHEKILVIDRQYRITDVNDSFLETINCTREEVLNNSCSRISLGCIGPKNDLNLPCNLSEVFKTGKAKQCLHFIKKEDGSKIWMDIIFSPIKEKNGNITHVIEAARDVTDQEQIKEKLQKSEEKYRLLVNNANDTIIIIQDKKIKFFNPKLTEITQCCHDELVNMDVLKLVHPEDRNTVSNRIEQFFKGEEISATYSFKIVKKDGNIVWIQPKTARIIWEGRPAILTFLRDISILKQEEEKRKMAEAQLLQSEKMASIGQLAAGVAHEINNPTGFVSSNLKTLSSYIKDIKTLLESYNKLDETVKKLSFSENIQTTILKCTDFIDKIKNEMDLDFVVEDISDLIEENMDGIERIKKIVLALKDFAHPGEDKPTYADINNNLDSTINVVWNELKYKAKVEKDYGDIPEVKCYPQMLNQVFMNLLVNGAQAIEHSGIIRISTRVVDDHIEICIADSGVGIPEKNISKIFDPFFTTKEVGKGTGLGLNVVYNIVQKHNGTIDVKSTVGKGTIFTIQLPTKNTIALDK